MVDISHRWELKPGAATIRLIVRDRLTNRYGTLDVPVKDIPHAAPRESAANEKSLLVCTIASVGASFGFAIVLGPIGQPRRIRPQNCTQR